MLLKKQVKLSMCNGANGFSMNGQILSEDNQFILFKDQKLGICQVNKSYIIYAQLMEENMEELK